MKILIVVEGGLVSDIYSDTQGLEIRILDFDILDGCDKEGEQEFLAENKDIITTDGDIDSKKILKEYPHRLF